VWAPGSWWLWLLAAVPVIKLVQFSGEVFGRYRRKLRATAIAAKRIQGGRFRAESVEGYCGDPCFRVVAREILARAGFPRTERNRLVGDFSRHVATRPDVVMFVDRERGVKVRVAGSQIERLGPEMHSQQSAN
jgi:hypothetical protein